MLLEHVFCQVMRPRSALYYALFAIILYRTNVDFNFSFQSCLATFTLNFIAISRFQIGESAGSVLVFPPAPAPEHLADFREFLKDVLQRGWDAHLSAGDGKMKFNFRSLISIGIYSTNEIFLPASHKDSSGQPYPAQDSTKLDQNALTSLNPNFPAVECALILEDVKTELFTKLPVHLYFQTQLRRAVDNMMKDHPHYGRRYKALQRNVPEATDLYQGSRAVASMVTCVHEALDKNVLLLDTECNSKIALLSRATCQ